MKIVTCKIDSTYVESILHIFDITGQLILKIDIKLDVAATDPPTRHHSKRAHHQQVGKKERV